MSDRNGVMCMFKRKNELTTAYKLEETKSEETIVGLFSCNLQHLREIKMHRGSA